MGSVPHQDLPHQRYLWCSLRNERRTGKTIRNRLCAYGSFGERIVQKKRGCYYCLKQCHLFNENLLILASFFGFAGLFGNQQRTRSFSRTNSSPISGNSGFLTIQSNINSIVLRGSAGNSV